MRRVVLFIIVVGIAVLLVGCGRQSTSSSDKNVVGYEVIDGQGTVIKLTKKPQKILPLSIGTDEMLVGIVPLERIAALTYLADDVGMSNIIEEAKKVPNKIKANPESIIALQPDLLIVADWQSPELVEIIREAGIPVYVYKTPSRIEEVKTVIMQLAQVVGEEEKGKKIVMEMDRKLLAVAEKLKDIPDNKRLTVVRFSLMGGSDGIGSLFDDICRHAHVVNAAATIGLGKNDIMSKEQIVQANPDVFIMPMWDYSAKTDIMKFKADIQGDPSFQSVSAIQQQKLFMLPDKHLASSSQYIVEAVYDIASVAYPEYMNKK